MAKKIKHFGMEMTDKEHKKWHEGNKKMTPAQHKAFMKKMGISEEEDKKWHEIHEEPNQTKGNLELKSVNPFAIGGGFLDYCIRQGWLVREKKGRHGKYFATKEGEKKLRKFGIEI